MNAYDILKERGFIAQVTYEDDLRKAFDEELARFFRDGVTEAERADREQYGDKRLLAFASAHAKDAPASFVENMERELDAFTAGAEQSDDITALAVLVDGGAAANRLVAEAKHKDELKC